MEIEKIAADRYRLRSHGQVMTVSAQDLIDVFEWYFGHISELKAEARIANEQEVRSGECVECGRYTSRLSAHGSCEGCVMQAAIDAIEEF